jgi:hypothetical protein
MSEDLSLDGENEASRSRRVLSQINASEILPARAKLMIHVIQLLECCLALAAPPTSAEGGGGMDPLEGRMV